MALTDLEDRNLLGVLYRIGDNRTPFINMIGGLNTGKKSSSFQFPINQNWALNAASQDVISEANAVSEQTATTYTRSQVYNVCQIMEKTAQVSYARESEYGSFSGLNVIAENPVKSEMSFQKKAAFEQLSWDIDYSFLQGTFVDRSASPTEMKTRGIIEAISTNAVAAGSTDLSLSLMKQLIRTMVGNGATLKTPIIFVNSFQKQSLSDIYGYAPEDRNLGGVNIKQIETDFGMFGIIYAPNVPAATLVIADVSYCYPVFVPFRSEESGTDRLIEWVPKKYDGAKMGGFWYTQVGLDYGHEKFHGKITGLTTS